MADDHYHQEHDEQPRYGYRGGTGTATLSHGVSGKSMVWASLAGVAIGGPLLGMMGFSFLATVTLVVTSSPVLLIFSPLLLGTVFVFAGALTGFTAAMGMAVAGFLSLSWIYRQVRGYLGLGLSLRGYERVKEQGQQDFGVGEYLERRVLHDENSSQSHENRITKS